MSQLRIKFFEETGVTWENSQGEPDIEYVNWLESKVENFNDLTTQVKSSAGATAKHICDLDKGTCQSQYGLDYNVGCSSGFSCKHKRLLT